MNLTDVFLVKIKIVRPIVLPRAMPPDAQRVYDKEAPTGHLSQAVGSNNSLPALAWEGGSAQVLNTQKQACEKDIAMILFYLSQPTDLLTVREQLSKENECSRPSLILVCQNGFHLWPAA